MTSGPYHLISLGTLLLLSYFLSLILVRSNLLPLQKQRKIWNTLLAVFFLSTTVLGLLLAVKVNYKLKIDWAEEALHWHVDLGIGFALVAIFHLISHFRYYFRPQPAPVVFKSHENSSSKPIFNKLENRSFFLLLGYISIIAQLVLLREFIKSFHGNELVIGIFLASWMMLTALGAKLGSGCKLIIPRDRIFLLLSLLGFIPLLIYLFLILAARFLFLPGFSPPLLDTSIVMLMLTTLFTGVSGFLFGYVSGEVNMGAGASAYRLDSLGSVVGGLFFGLILVHFFDNIQLLTFLCLSTTLAVALIYFYPARKAWRITLILVAAMHFTASMVPSLENVLEELRFRGEKILDTRDTPYGNLSFTSRDEQVNAYLDGNPIFSSSDLIQVEESVHFPALQHPDPRSFLLLGGGSSACLSEIGKYQPERIFYCEANSRVFELEQIHMPLQENDALSFFSRDGRTWLSKFSGNRQFDVVISTACNPMTLGWNRYFTLEFYNMVNDHLAPGGVFCMRLSTSDNYVNEEGIRMLAINSQTLKEVFSHVLLVPGSSVYFLASDHSLSLDFPSLLAQRNIPTTYVHPNYMDASHLLFDSDQLTNQIKTELENEKEPKLNRDLRPRLFFSSLAGIESRTGKHSLKITGFLSVLLFLIFLFRYGPVKRAMYISGFSGAGIQIILIMVMQSFYGFAYMVAPMMITLFMAGIVAGTFLKFKILQPNSLTGLAVLIGIMGLISICCAILLGNEAFFNSHWSGKLILGLLNILPGILVGSVYCLGVSDREGNNPGIFGVLYGADLIGAAMGTILPALFLLPLIGVINTFKLFFLINLLAGLSLLIPGIKKRTYG